MNTGNPRRRRAGSRPARRICIRGPRIRDLRGRGVSVAVIDSGVNPEHPHVRRRGGWREDRPLGRGLGRLRGPAGPRHGGLRGHPGEGARGGPLRGARLRGPVEDERARAGGRDRLGGGAGGAGGESEPRDAQGGTRGGAGGGGGAAGGGGGRGGRGGGGGRAEVVAGFARVGGGGRDGRGPAARVRGGAGGGGGQGGGGVAVSAADPGGAGGAQSERDQLRGGECDGDGRAGGGGGAGGCWGGMRRFIGRREKGRRRSGSGKPRWPDRHPPPAT